MHVEYDAGGRRFKIQKEPYGPVAIVNFSQTVDSSRSSTVRNWWSTGRDLSSVASTAPDDRRIEDPKLSGDGDASGPA